MHMNDEPTKIQNFAFAHREAAKTRGVVSGLIPGPIVVGLLKRPVRAGAKRSIVTQAFASIFLSLPVKIAFRVELNTFSIVFGGALGVAFCIKR